MKCERNYDSIIHKYLDGEASKAEKEELEAHLMQCTECMQHIRELKKAIAFVQSASHIEAPKDFTSQVMAKLPKKDAPSKTKVTWKRWMRQHPMIVAVAVFVLLMSASVSTLWQNDHEQVSFSGSGNIQIDQESRMVVVPSGEVVEGDLMVRNGQLVIEGEVRGNILLVNSEPYLASAGHVSGEIEEVNQALEWVWYHTKNFFSDVVSILDKDS